MAEPTRDKQRKKRKKAPTSRREERRFTPVLSGRSKMIYGAAGLAAAVLGAGVYGQFRTNFIEGAEGPMKNASYVLGAGALALAAVVLVFPEMPRPILVGDAGVAVETSTDEEERVYWCDVVDIKLVEGFVVVRSEDTTIKASLEEHPQAAAWIVREARERVPDVLEISSNAAKGLPAVDDAAGEVRVVPDLQIAGRHCAETGDAITFAPDARLCPRCLECYHKDHVPTECVSCGGSLEEPIEGTA